MDDREQRAASDSPRGGTVLWAVQRPGGDQAAAQKARPEKGGIPAGNFLPAGQQGLRVREPSGGSVLEMSPWPYWGTTGRGTLWGGGSRTGPWFGISGTCCFSRQRTGWRAPWRGRSKELIWTHCIWRGGLVFNTLSFQSHPQGNRKKGKTVTQGGEGVHISVRWAGAWAGDRRRLAELQEHAYEAGCPCLVQLLPPLPWDVPRLRLHPHQGHAESQGQVF